MRRARVVNTVVLTTLGASKLIELNKTFSVFALKVFFCIRMHPFARKNNLIGGKING